MIPHDKLMNATPHPFSVAEERHQEEEGDGQDLHEEIERHEVGTENRPDEADGEERKQTEEPRVVPGSGLEDLALVEHVDPVLNVADGVEGQGST